MKSGYMRPRNSVKAIEKAKYDAFKSQCMRVTALCALAVLNDLWDISNEEMQEWYDNFEKLMKSINMGIDNLDKLEKELSENCGIEFENVTGKKYDL